jgi:hypothetical protein
MNKLNLWLLIVAVVLGTMIAMNESRKPDDVSSTLSSPISNTKEYSVVRIHVLSGHEFDLTFENGKRILGKLEVKTPVDATKKVVRLLRKSTNPRAILLRDCESYWEVDLRINVDGRETTLSDWLKENRLVWE